MSGTIYSYKPGGGGLEGASTVLTLKTGELLELRRGAKTRWSAGSEPRQQWASLEEWKATLPAGAEVTVHGDPEAEKAAIAVESEDFRRVIGLGASVLSTRLTLHTNKLDASRLMAKCRVAERRRDRTVYAASLRRFDEQATRCRRLAEKALAAEPYAQFAVRSYRARCERPMLMARRTTDGVFILLFVDLERKLFHTPQENLVTATTATTLAELGLDRVLLVRTGMFGMRMVTL